MSATYQLVKFDMGVSIAACLLGSAVPHQLQVACRTWPCCTAALLLKAPLLLHSPLLSLSIVSLHALQWEEDAHDGSWLDRAWNWLLSPATLTHIAAPVAGLHFAYHVRLCAWQAAAAMPVFFGACAPGRPALRHALALDPACRVVHSVACPWPLWSQERFHPAARWAFQAVAAAYVAGQLCFRVACAFNLFTCIQLFGCTGPAALLAGCGPLLLVLAPLLWGQWVRIIGTVVWGRRMAADAQAAAAWERVRCWAGLPLRRCGLLGAGLSRGMCQGAATMWQLLSPCQRVSPLLPPAAQARRFGSAFWPFDLVHAMLCRLARALERAGWQQPEAAAAERPVPEPAPALWPTGSSWLQRLRHVYMLHPELFKCPHAGLTLRPWRLLPAAWRAVSDTARARRGERAQVWRKRHPSRCCAQLPLLPASRPD